MKEIFKKIIAILEKLSSEPRVGSLRITNTSLQYVLLMGEKAKNVSVELPGGVVEDGIIKDGKEFGKALEKLHDMIAPKKKEEAIKAIVSLPADLIYTQSFKIPFVKEEKREESANLNLQMITPIKAEKSFMSWQEIQETDNEVELLGAFVEKKNVVQIQEALDKANFYPATFEFPALGLTRLLNKAQGPQQKSVLIIDISGDGMDFLIIKNGALYFDYFISWKEVQGKNKEISKEAFEETLTKEIRKVSNFTLSRAGEGIENILFIAPGMEERVSKLIQERAGVNASPFIAKNEKLDASWYGVIGSSLRGSGREEKKEINLGPETLTKAFFEERLVRFIKLWRNIGIVVLGTFLLVDGGFAALVTTQSKALNSQISGFKTRASGQELDELEKKADEFNRLVASVEKVRDQDKNWYAFLINLKKLAIDKDVTITQVEVSSGTNVINIVAEGKSHDAVIEFKNTLVEEPTLEDVDLPLSRISVSEQNRVNFTLSFKIKDQ